MRSLAVFLGGILGTLARWGVDEFVAGSDTLEFPWAVFFVNVTGAFVLGYVAVALIERMPGAANLRGFLLIGLLGSYTTFSTLAFGGAMLVEGGEPLIAAAYWVSTVTVGMVAAIAGTQLGRAVT